MNHSSEVPRISRIVLSARSITWFNTSLHSSVIIGASLYPFLRLRESLETDGNEHYSFQVLQLSICKSFSLNDNVVKFQCRCFCIDGPESAWQPQRRIFTSRGPGLDAPREQPLGSPYLPLILYAAARKGAILSINRPSPPMLWFYTHTLKWLCARISDTFVLFPYARQLSCNANKLQNELNMQLPYRSTCDTRHRAAWGRHSLGSRSENGAYCL
jgi:hypothetical protein